MDECPICRGSGEIHREQAVNVRFEGDGELPPESCYACGGSGKYEDYLKWENKQPKRKPERKDKFEQYEREPPDDEDDWRGRRIIEE